MKRVAFVLVAMGGLVALALPVIACPVGYSTFSYSSYVAPVQKVQAIIAPVAVYQAIPVLVPTYTAGYVQPLGLAPAATAAPCTEELRVLRQQIEALKLQMQRPQQMPPADPFGQPQAQRTPEASSVGQVFGTHCAKCHEGTVAVAKGGGFKMIEGGNLAQLTDRQVSRIATQTTLGKMPRGSKLSDAELGLILQWADTATAAAAPPK